MGQRASTQRPPRDQDSDNLPSSFRLSQSPRLTAQASRNPHQTIQDSLQPQPHNRSARPFATFSRHISAASIPAVRGRLAEQGPTVSRRDAFFYEQQEERPLLHMEELGMRDAPITYITASPMPRRSRLSRLSSMLVSRDINNERVRIPPDGPAHQQRSLHRDSLEIARESQRRRSRRSSLIRAASSGAAETNASGRRRAFATIADPVPRRGDSITPSSFLAVSSRTNALRQQYLSESHGGTHETLGFNDSSVSRLARLRRSVSLSWDAHPPILRSSTHNHATQTPPQGRIAGSLPNSDFTYLPPLGTADYTANFNTTFSSDHNAGQETHRVGPRISLEAMDQSSTPTRSSGWADRWSDRSSIGRRESRSVPSTLGGRSARLLRRDHDGPLPRILSLAAFAIAAQLTGSTEQTAGNLEAIRPDNLDGNLHNLYQALQDNLHRSAGETAAVGNENGIGVFAGPSTPLNYLRVFRFVSDTANTEGQPDASTWERSYDSNPANDRSATTEARPEESEGRTVTLVVVGVRSVPSEEAARDAHPTSEPILSPLPGSPPLVSTSDYVSDGSRGLLRNANGRSRLDHYRRASSGGTSTIPDNYDNQSQQRTTSTNRPSSMDTAHVSGFATPPGVPSITLSDSPAGPHPPPSTPAEPGLSAYSSQATTPSRRPSLASAVPHSQLPLREAVLSQHREAASPITEDQEPPVPRVQQRRRSDNEFGRHIDLGAGAARRNGVVAPDDGDTANSTAAGSRSWLIYVVGTNLAQDHPALTAPSLFTDVSISKAKRPTLTM